MRAVILSVGDELTSGLTVNTNAAWLGQRLMGLGIEVSAHITVGDQLDAIARAIREAAASAQLIIISGGLGPTEDDVTREALAAALNEELIEDAPALENLRTWFRAHSRTMSASNHRQAMRPRSARCLENTCGTAPGLAATLGAAKIFVVPGVPREMREMVERSILPELTALTGNQATVIRKINTFGWGESIVGEKIRDLMARGASPSVGTTVHDGIVSVRVYATGPRADAQALAARAAATVRDRLGPIVFGEGEESLEDAVAKLLIERNQTIATAESCTGGLLAEMLTNISGSSAYFTRGWVTYANAAKVEELGVEAEVITKVGAVSEEVARAMAHGARRQARTDYALATTGIAGPAGGTPEKPVGTVWIALASESTTETRRFIFPGNRAAIRQRAAQMALALLRWNLIGAGAVV